jgi:mevalonate kinase
MAAPANGSRSKISNGHTIGSPASTSSQDSLVDDMDGTHLERPGNKRKVSSPLMPAFMVSAPGKVIVYGEHAVVHGKVGKHSILEIRI